MPLSPQAVHDRLASLPRRRSLDAALELLDALGHQYADELPLPTCNWPDGVQRVACQAAESLALSVFCQVGKCQRLYLVHAPGAPGGYRSADPALALRGARCEEDEPTLALPADVNAQIAAVKRGFDAGVRAPEAELRHTVGRALGRDYALDELRLVFGQTEDAEEKARLVLLSEILSAARSPPAPTAS
jgi:hypothetical protein